MQAKQIFFNGIVKIYDICFYVFVYWGGGCGDVSFVKLGEYNEEHGYLDPREIRRLPGD
jgi:hypothetical protein